MKNWLIQKEEEQNKLFQDLLDISINTLKNHNKKEKTKLYIRVIFSKDKWLDGHASIEFLEKNNDHDYDCKSRYNHSIYNSDQDISAKSPLFKLMSDGLFTNSWFSILDSSRKYDTTFILTDNKYILENENCEYRENKMKETHTGFNMQSKSPKNKIK